MENEEQKEFVKKQKLIEEDYSYDNMVNNPILKPIAEADRTISDYIEIIYKKVVDATNRKKSINKKIEDIPAYQTSNMVGEILRLNAEYDDIVKLKDLQILKYVDCIREMYKLVNEKYGIYKEEVKEKKQFDYKDYLNSISDKEAKDYAKLILKEFEEDKVTTNQKKRFEIACGEIYSKESDKNKQTIIAKIMRREY